MQGLRMNLKLVWVVSPSLSPGGGREGGGPHASFLDHPHSGGNPPSKKGGVKVKNWDVTKGP